MVIRKNASTNTKIVLLFASINNWEDIVSTVEITYDSKNAPISDADAEVEQSVSIVPTERIDFSLVHFFVRKILIMKKKSSRASLTAIILTISMLVTVGCGNNSKPNSEEKTAESTPVSDLELYSDPEQDEKGIETSGYSTERVLLKLLKYDYSDARGLNDRFEIRLFSDGSFQYLTSFTSSLIVSGTWDTKYGVLCLQDYSPERDTDDIDDIATNCFSIDGDRITYLKDYSCGFSRIELEDGAKFKDTDPESGELTDVLIAAQDEFGGARHVNRNPFDYLEDDRIFLGEWICDKSGETVMISMADVQVGGYHFEIERGDQRVGYGDAYNTDHKLILTQAYYNDEFIDGVIEATDNGLSFGFSVTGKDENKTYAGDGVIELVCKTHE